MQHGDTIDGGTGYAARDNSIRRSAISMQGIAVVDVIRTITTQVLETCSGRVRCQGTSDRTPYCTWRSLRTLSNIDGGAAERRLATATGPINAGSTRVLQVETSAASR